MSRTGAVVVTHRTPVRAGACAERLRTSGADTVVVVDSGSGDDSVERLRAAGHVVVALGDVGFGRAANAGVAVLPGDVDVVVVANADATFTGEAVTLLADALRRQPGVVATGPRVTYPDGRVQASARRVPSLPEAVGHGLFGLWWPSNPWTRRYRGSDLDPDEPRDVDWLSGCALALDRSAFTAVGGFDPGYFLYAEDVDLAVRLRAAGGRLRTEPRAHVVHDVGVSTGRRPVRSLVLHARSLERFAGRHVLTGPWALARPLLRVALAGWVVTSLAWRRAVGARRGRASTGE